MMDINSISHKGKTAVRQESTDCVWLSHVTKSIRMELLKNLFVSSPATDKFVSQYGSKYPHLCFSDFSGVIALTSCRGDKGKSYPAAAVSVQDLLNRLDGVVKQQSILDLRQRFDAFDKIVGAPVCDSLVQTRTANQWIYSILVSMVYYIEGLSSAELYGNSEKKLLEKDAKPDYTPLTLTPTKSTSISTAETLVNGAGVKIIEPTKADDQIPLYEARAVKQIKLRGANLIEAWNNCPELAKLYSSPSRHWAPTQQGLVSASRAKNSSIAGVSNRVCDLFTTSFYPALDYEVASLVASGQPFVRREQAGSSVAPLRHLGSDAYFTAFHSYLISAFEAEVIGNCGNEPPGARLSRVWETEDSERSFSGLALFQFKGAPFHIKKHKCSVARMDAEMTSGLYYGSILTDNEPFLLHMLNGVENTRGYDQHAAWSLPAMKQMHGSWDGKRWPSVVFSREQPDTLKFLAKNCGLPAKMLWKAGLTGLNAHSVLREAHKRTLVIDFVQDAGAASSGVIGKIGKMKSM
ncbi:hypothetical protein CFIMG_007738RA00001 [Ceratocystis fimbriata CBS 114723]|uniref:Uncharacterized protein n=1 Tax=Ceratocystis fimbriata CBS 114723 TaxID=1035309 RepID=A0A2C5XDR8_9PEZI|nr:hypothetical protein CFIMG_007738RA00001 [Ceratocystis fimbriata CBS 114723]